LTHIKAEREVVRGIFGVMPHPVVEFTTVKRFVRRARELKTIQAMLRLYCRGHGHADRAPLCGECGTLLEYATRRLERCVFGDAKPTCTNCVVHCYSDDARAHIRIVMRWAGPRMLLRHPILGILHKLDGRRPAPLLPAKAVKRRRESAVTEQSGGR
jgi:hypothetical protein